MFVTLPAAGNSCPTALSRAWQPGRPVDAHATLGSLRRGTGDPSYLTTPEGAIWRSCRTPDGPGTLRVEVRPRDGTVHGHAWGAGASWLLDHLPSFLGEDDDPSGFVPDHPVLAETARARPGWRVPRTGLVLDSLVPAVLEQKVTGAEARRSWRELLWRFGEPAPGPVPAPMRVLPAPEVWVGLPSWEWHRAGVTPQRAGTLVRVARAARRLEETLTMSPADADRRLRAVPGVGVWTSAEVRQRAHGHADAVSVGDYHLPALVGAVLAGRGVDDAGMLDLLAPYTPHRYRVQRLVELAGVRLPRRGPRLPARDYRRM